MLSLSSASHGSEATVRAAVDIEGSAGVEDSEGSASTDRGPVSRQSFEGSYSPDSAAPFQVREKRVQGVQLVLGSGAIGETGLHVDQEKANLQSGRRKDQPQIFTCSL